MRFKSVPNTWLSSKRQGEAWRNNYFLRYNEWIFLSIRSTCEWTKLWHKCSLSALKERALRDLSRLMDTTTGMETHPYYTALLDGSLNLKRWVKNSPLNQGDMEPVQKGTAQTPVQVWLKDATCFPPQASGHLYWTSPDGDSSGVFCHFMMPSASQKGKTADYNLEEF